jgi:hypothetical protein
MRINYWVGLPHSIHIVRDILKQCPSVNTPILPIYKTIYWVHHHILDDTSIVPYINDIWDTNDKKEFNIGSSELDDNRNNLLLSPFMERFPLGSRFWFFRFKDIADYEDAYDDDTNDPLIRGWVGEIKKKIPGWRDLPRREIFNKLYTRIDKIAGMVGAESEWRDFNLSVYSDGAVDLKTNLEYRLYSKP